MSDRNRNSHCHNPYATSDYCPNCDGWHPIYECPEDGETRKQYERRIRAAREQWDRDYRS